MAISQVGLPTTGSASVGNGAVYWIGNDGNIYLKGAPGVSGVANLGQAPSSLGIDNNVNNGYGITGNQINLPGANYAATLIANPSASATTTSTASTGGGSGSSSTPVSQATINAILQSIANQVASNQVNYDNAAAANAANDTNEQNQYRSQVTNNTEGRATAIQNAEQAAAQGGQGLRAVLASLGALGGTGQVLANRMVASAANNDVGGADQTYQTNATAINQANTDYLNQARSRDTTLKNNLATDNAAAHNTGIQDILNDASNQGDIATYNQFLPQLAPSAAATQSIAPTPLTFNPAAVNTYAPTSGVTVKAAPAQTSLTTPVNSALYVTKDNNSPR